jgi:quercetin dioxygenase-like cupin family protein
MSIRPIAAVAVLALLTAPAHAQERPLAVAYDSSAIAWSPCPSVFPEGCELTVLHGDPARPGADVLLRVAPGQTLPDHSHTSAELMMLASGRLTVKYRGVAEATLTPGTYAFGPAGLAHRATCISDEPCVLFIAFDGAVDASVAEGVVD